MSVPVLTLSQIPVWLESENAEARTLGGEFLGIFDTYGEILKVDVDSDASEVMRGKVAWVDDGVLKYGYGDGVVRFFVEGDIVTTLGTSSRLHADFSTELKVIPEKGFFGLLKEHGLEEKWSKFLDRQSVIYQGLCSVHIQASSEPAVKIERYAAGDHIIVEGDTSNDIFVLVSGSARVLFEGREVGQIGENEIFGEMNFLIGEDRVATVSAVSSCLVQRVPGEEFGRLLAQNPQLGIDLARTMARRIVSLNRRVDEFDTKVA